MKETEEANSQEKSTEGHSQLYLDFLKTQPRYASNAEALAGMTSELTALAAKLNLSVEQLINESEKSAVFREDHLLALSLARRIGYFKSKTEKEK